MGLSKRSLRGIYALNAIQRLPKHLKYLVPQLTAHEEALKMNIRFDKERLQKENRLCRIKNLQKSK